jgi:hypothetical protein
MRSIVFHNLHRISFVLLVVSTITGMYSCAREEHNTEFDDMPVVEAYLVAGKTFEMKVSRLVPFDEQASFSPDDIDKLNIIIERNNAAMYTLSPLGKGQYADSSLVITSSDRYDLRFIYNGREVSARTVIPSRPSGFQQSTTKLEIPPSTGMGFGSQSDPVQLTWDNPDRSWYVLVVENTEAAPKPIREGDSTRTTSFRNQPVQRDYYDLRVGSFTHYGRHRIILFHLTPDYALLFDEGETTSQNLTTPSTGITNGVGIFTGMDADTLWLAVTEQ